MLAIYDLLHNLSLLTPHRELFYAFPAMIAVGLVIAFANRNTA
jgi:hypothetical protein